MAFFDACVCVCVGQRWCRGSFSITPQCTLLNKVSLWTWSSLIQLDQLSATSSRDLCLCLSSTRIFHSRWAHAYRASTSPAIILAPNFVVWYRISHCSRCWLWTPNSPLASTSWMTRLPIHFKLADKNDMCYIIHVILKFIHFRMVKLSSPAYIFSYIILYDVDTYIVINCIHYLCNSSLEIILPI